MAVADLLALLNGLWAALDGGGGRADLLRGGAGRERKRGEKAQKQPAGLHWDLPVKAGQTGWEHAITNRLGSADCFRSATTKWLGGSGWAGEGESQRELFTEWDEQ
jgi:hypothetical protein